jgi:ribosomal protein S27E
MSVFAGVRCDICGTSLVFSHAGKTHIVSWAREEGWTVGKYVKCPNCKSKK